MYSTITPATHFLYISHHLKETVHYSESHILCKKRVLYLVLQMDNVRKARCGIEISAAGGRDLIAAYTTRRLIAHWFVIYLPSI